jgi:hypothetical protein
MNNPIESESAVPSPEYLALEDLTETIVVTHPRATAAIVEFKLYNEKGGAVPAETIEPLRWLGTHPEYRGKAVELLGIVAQDEDPEVAAAAETAIRSVLRKKRSD